MNATCTYIALQTETSKTNIYFFFLNIDQVTCEMEGSAADRNSEDLIVKNSVKFEQPSFTVHTFSEKILDGDVYFHVLGMSESFYIWIGKSDNFGELSVAMAMKEKQPSSTVLIGGSASQTVTLAERLSKRTGKQVFVSGEIDSFSHLELPLIEKKLAEEMKAKPDMF